MASVLNIFHILMTFGWIYCLRSFFEVFSSKYIFVFQDKRNILWTITLYFSKTKSTHQEKEVCVFFWINNFLFQLLLITYWLRIKLFCWSASNYVLRYFFLWPIVCVPSLRHSQTSWIQELLKQWKINEPLRFLRVCFNGV